MFRLYNGFSRTKHNYTTSQYKSHLPIRWNVVADMRRLFLYPWLFSVLPPQNRKSTWTSFSSAFSPCPTFLPSNFVQLRVFASIFFYSYLVNTNDLRALKSTYIVQMSAFNRRQLLSDAMVLVWDREVEAILVSSCSFPQQGIQHNQTTLTQILTHIWTKQRHCSSLTILFRSVLFVNKIAECVGKYNVKRQHKCHRLLWI